MLWLRRLLWMLPWARKEREQSLDEEIRAHFEMASEDTESTKENAIHVQEQARDAWVLPSVEHLTQDLRYALRTLPRAPLFTSVAILSLGLGIGAATAVFSLVNGVVLKPLAFREPGRLVFIREVIPGLSHVYPTLPVNLQHFFYWREHTNAFASIAAVRADKPTVTGLGEPFDVDGIETSADLFQVLGTNMALGRGFLAGEDKRAKDNVAVVTDSFWRKRLGANPNVIGSSIMLEGVPTTIVGVLPSSFTFPKGNELGQLSGLGKQIEIVRPLRYLIDDWDGDYDFICLARLGPGVAPERGLAELKGMTAQLIKANKVESDPHPALTPLQDQMAGPVRTSLFVLLGAVMALLLIVCVNLANLSLARASVRTREFSIRAALGAGRKHLIQQVVTETAVLSICGGILGVAFSMLFIRLFVATAELPIPRLNEVTIDGRVALFALAVTMLSAAIFGIIPALRIGRADPQDSLKSGTHTASSNKQALRLRQGLIGFEVALSTVLLFLAGLLISSVFRVLRVDKGFAEERAFSVDLSLPEVQYPSDKERNLFFDRLLQNVRTVNGVKSAAMIMGLPLTGESHVNGIDLEGEQAGNWIQPSSTEAILINVRFISADYFATLGIPLVQGRAIDSHEMNRHVAVVSERLASKVWPGKNPLGKRFKTGSQAGQLEVIGVVKDVHNGPLDKEPTLIVYVPYTVRGPNYGSLVVRTDGSPAALMPSIRRAIWSVDSRIPVPPFVTMGELVDNSVAARRFQMRLTALFGAAALCLALIGIYGVVAYNVSARRTEMGVRLALGAKPTELTALMVWRGLRPVWIGLIIGLAASVFCGQLIRSLLFGVEAVDPFTLGAVALVLLVTGSVACFLPALSIARMDPATALHYE